MRFLLSGGDTVVGVLTPVERGGSVGIQLPCFRQPLELPIETILEAQRVRDNASPGGSIDASAGAYSVDLVTGNRWIGRLGAGTGDGFELITAWGQEIALSLERVARMEVASRTTRERQSLKTSRHRFERDPGWSFDEGGALVGRMPGDAVVGRLQLPSRFRMELRMVCDGDADFELTLGDLVATRDQREDRRGGSLSRLPSERFVTRMEWFGASATLVRSNPSVSDSAVIPIDGRELKLDLLVDQTVGKVAAFQDGVLLAQVQLADENPLLRDSVTLITRGDTVHVERLTVSDWNGVDPESRALPEKYTLLKDGTLLPHAIKRLENDDVVVDAPSPDDGVTERTFSTEQLLATRLRDPVPDPGTSRFDLDDGSHLWGTPAGNGDPFTIQTQGSQFAIDPVRVEAIRGSRGKAGEPLPVEATLSVAGGKLVGRLVDGSEVGETFGWKIPANDQTVGIVESSGVTVSWQTSEPAATEKRGAMIEWTEGDRLPASSIRINGQTLSFHSDVFGDLQLSTDALSRVRLRGASSEPTDDELALLLRLPRRQKSAPPRHLVFSVTGDVLRCDLLALTDTEARVAVRDSTRVLPVESISQIIWLEQTAGRAQSCAYVATTRDAADVGLLSARWVGEHLQVEHETFGQGRLPSGTLQTFHFGDRQSVPASTWRLEPVKEPRSFDETE